MLGDLAAEITAIVTEDHRFPVSGNFYSKSGGTWRIARLGTITLTVAKEKDSEGKQMFTIRTRTNLDLLSNEHNVTLTTSSVQLIALRVQGIVNEWRGVHYPTPAHN